MNNTEELKMRLIWAKRRASPMPPVDRLHFVMWDFLKMFLAAVVCGVAVSLIAAGVTLLLARDVQAATPRAVPGAGKTTLAGPGTNVNVLKRSYPGVLLLSAGCDGEALDAMERDWSVTIHNNSIDVRVMQTFVVPVGESSAATFDAMLPARAQLLRLAVHTSGSTLSGRVFDKNAFEQLTGDDFRKFSRRKMLIVQIDDGAISTDAINNLVASEAVTIEYTYRLTIDSVPGPHNLLVTLANDNNPVEPPVDNHPVSGAVWVQWQGTLPSRLLKSPSGAFLETSGSRITALSWATQRLNADSRFQLAWSM
jgi:hypothetical protein